MPRSFGGRSNSRGRSSSSGPSSRSYGSSSGSSYQAKPQPSFTQQTPSQRPGMFGGGGLGSTMATGMAFGGGSAIGHSVVGSMMGGREGHHSQPQYPMEKQNQTGNVDKPSEAVNEQLKVIYLFNLESLFGF